MKNQVGRTIMETEQMNCITRTRVFCVMLLMCGCTSLMSAQTISPNVRVNQDPTGAGRNQNETTIAFNPTNPLNVVAGSNYYAPDIAGPRVAYYRSTDWGYTWAQDTLPRGGSYDKSGDPAVAFNHDGVVYYAHLSIDLPGQGEFARDNGIFVNRSTDGGVTWRSTPFVVVQNGDGSGTAGREVREDRPQIACDQNGGSPFVNGVYVCWIHGTNGGTDQVHFSHWDDEMGQFSLPIQISDQGGARAPAVAVGPNGIVYVVWYSTDGTVQIAKSTNGGVSFGTDQIVASNVIDVGTVRHTIRALTYACIAVDNSGGDYNGRVYVSWGARQNDSPEIYMRIGTPSGGGLSWGNTFIVNQTTANDQWFPWVTVAPNGRVHAVYYDSRNDVNNVLTDVYVATSFDGGGSFTEAKVNGQSFNPSVGFPAQDFMGDYNGIAVTREYSFPFWTDMRFGTDQDVFVARMDYTKEVTVDQQYSTLGSFGTIGRWHGSSFSPRLPHGQPVPFVFGTKEVLQAEQDISDGEKYNRWVDEPNVTNHHQFYVNPAGFPGNLTALFKPAQMNVTIENSLVDIPNAIGDSIEFRDPWLIDYPDPLYGSNLRNRGQDLALWYRRGSPFSLSSPGTANYQGVFLDQEAIPGQPYYWTRALQTPLPGYNWQFLGWEGAGADIVLPTQYETPVVFRQAGATVKAWYKAHLVSSSSAVTSPNTQRKVVRDEQGTYHAVYESGGKLWYTKSTNNGADWSPETRAYTDDNATHKNPSVVYHRFPPRLIVACEGISGNVSSLKVYQISLPSGAVAEITPMWSRIIPVSEEYPMNPVIAHGEPSQEEENTIVVWYDWEAQMLKGAVLPPNTQQWSPETDLRPGISIFSLASFSKWGSPWHLVWTENNNLYYRPIFNTNPLTLGDIQTVAEGREDVSIESPSVVSLLRQGCAAAVAWQNRPLEFFDWTINFRQQDEKGNWYSPILVVASRRPLTNCSLGSERYFYTDNVVLAFQADNSKSSSVAYVTRYAGNWSKVFTLDAGVAPSVSVSSEFSYGTEEQLLWRGSSAGPFSLTHAAITLGMKPGGAMAVEGRGGRISYPNGSIHFVILEPTLDSNNIAFTALQDTLSIRGRDAFEAAVRSGDFAGRGTLALRLLYRTTGTVPASARLRFELVDTLTGQTINSIRTLRGVGDSSIALRLPLAHGQRRVRLRVRVEGLSQTARYEVERWIVMPTDSSSSSRQSLVAKTAPSSATPTEYNLHAPYPNPFNPSTQINFELLDAGNISLVVYDMLGREVANLASGYREAGYHSATWNASGQASGVYFARFNVTNAEGKVTYAKVNKLVLTK
ncbi:MAG TPA: hypothetical protein DGH68_07995 [Bacteroidetes bacterium]|nr:hypothetical protein [Bacteroidota bacterium]